MDNLLETYSTQTMNQEETDDVKRLLIRSEIESVINIKKNPYKQKSRTTRLHKWILQNVQSRTYTDLSQTLPEDWRGGMLPKTFYEGTVTPIPKPDMDNTKKENYRPMSSISIDAIILNKIAANWIQGT